MSPVNTKNLEFDYLKKNYYRLSKLETLKPIQFFFLKMHRGHAETPLETLNG
jgi:hypothetical protein